MIPESGRRHLGAVLRYSVAVLLALSAQLARLPLASPTSIAYITYVPFILMSAALGGIGPGLLATGLCSLEALYFATEPIGTFTADQPQHWLGLGTLALTGVVGSVLFELLIRARREAVAGAETRAQLAREVETRQRMLESKRAEEALEAAYSELAAIYANTPVVLLVVDDQLRVEKVNDLATRFAGREMSDILGLSPAEAFGCLDALADPQGCGHGPSCSKCPVRLAVLDALRGGTRHNRVEGWLPLSIGGRQQQRCLLVSTAAMQFDRATKVLVCAQDITELKLAQLELQRREEALRETVRELESALAEKTVLLQEVHHRVKNNLAVISSLLGMKADAAGSSDAKMALEESRQRVHSMALIHEHLYGNDRLDRIDFSEYARQLVQGLYSTSVGEPDRISIRMDLDPIELGIERAVPCALILNELLSNALKYAFPDGRNGKILVRSRESEPGSLELTVEDNGIGLPAGRLGARNTESLGLRIVRILTQQLDGSLEQEACPGTRIVLRFPVGQTIDSRRPEPRMNAEERGPVVFNRR